MKIKTNLLLLAATVFFLSSCSRNHQPKDFDYGKVENNIYQNSFFGFELSLPADWVVQTQEQTETLAKVGKELVAGGDKEMKAAIRATEVNTANLLSVFQYEVGAPVDYNPGIVLVAENLRMFPGIKNGGDYLFQTRKLLRQAQIEYSYIDEEFSKEMIDNQEFYLMNATIDYLGQSIHQMYYSTIINGFSLNVIASYTGEEQKKELQESINSMAFSE